MRDRSPAPTDQPRLSAQRDPRGSLGRTGLAARARLVALAVAVLALLGVVAGSGTALAAAPARPTAVKSTLAGKVITVRWKATRTGTVRIAVRRTTASGKPRTATRLVRARSGKATITLPSALAPAAVRVRLRRCTGSGRSVRCSRWTTWANPTTTDGAGSTATPIVTPTPTPAPAAGGGSGAPVGSVAPGTTTPVTTPPGDGPTIGGCPQMPSGWALNQRVDSLPLAAKSAAYVGFLNKGRTLLHPDFGSADLGAGPEGFGIPFRVVPENQPLVRIDLGIYADESDPGPYPIPLDTPVEGGDQPGDRHVSVVQQVKCKLYELGNATAKASSWEVSGAYTFDLVSGAPRPVGWTSGDAAGLPILPLLARYDEAASGRIKHAIRMTSRGIAEAYIPPASHFAPTSTDADAPPMGQRFRLKASYDLSKLTGNAKVIAIAMKEYGLVLADTGSDWFFTGAPDRRWDEDNLSQLKGIPGSAFEAVDSGPIVRR